MRNVLSPNVRDIIDRLEAEYNDPSTSEQRKLEIFRQGQDAVMTATLASMHTQGMSPCAPYAVSLYQAATPVEPATSKVSPPSTTEDNPGDHSGDY